MTRSRLRFLVAACLALLLPGCFEDSPGPSITAPNGAPDHSSAPSALVQVSDLTAASGRSYVAVTGGMSVGAPVYTDRTYTWETLPALVEGLTYIQTSMNDKSVSGDPDFLSFRIDREATLYVAYAGTAPPAWLADNFTATGLTVVMRKSLGRVTFNLYAKNVPAGVVTLGSNLPGDGENDTYALMLAAAGTTEELIQVSEITVTRANGGTRNYAAVLGGLTNGAPVYIDRAYTYDSIPEPLQGQTYIQTAQSEQFVADDSSFLSFRIDRPAGVYVAYHGDSPPSWMSDFAATGQRVVVVKDGAELVLRLFVKSFPAGIVTLGSNQVGDATAMYTVVVGPTPSLAPVANADGPYSGKAGIPMAFEGSASTDPDGDLPLSYAWDFGDGSTGTGPTPSHTYASEGSYTVKLVVTDARGARSDTARATVGVAPGGPGHFASVSAGWRHTCALTTTGKAYCWGKGSDAGQLGQGLYRNSWIPIAVVGGLTFSSVSAGQSHTCGLTPAGTPYCWGANDQGQLGTGDTIGTNRPVRVQTDLTFTYLGAGGAHTCGRTPDNAAYCWGANNSGQLGTGDTISSRTPVRVTGNFSVMQLSVGWEHNCLVTADGGGRCWGSNYKGQLGNGRSADSSTPQRVYGGLAFSKISTTGVGTGSGNLGQNHSCGLTTTGEAYCWGDNYHNALGINPDAEPALRGHFNTPQRVQGVPAFMEIVTGSDHGCGLTSSGQMWCWGDNVRGQLGNGPQEDQNPAIAVAGGHTFTRIAAGWDHNCGLTPNDDAYCWGWNHRGQVGDGTGADEPHKPRPVLVVTTNVQP